jgi:hypothetical protein
MGFDSFPIVGQGSQIDPALLEDENSARTRSKVAHLERNDFRRYSIRKNRDFPVEAKNYDDDRKPAAKVLPSTRSRDGVKVVVSRNLHYASNLTSYYISLIYPFLSICNIAVYSI